LDTWAFASSGQPRYRLPSSFLVMTLLPRCLDRLRGLRHRGWLVCRRRHNAVVVPAKARIPVLQSLG
jgi:hypothetical protein